jgi:hypothetical protein
MCLVQGHVVVHVVIQSRLVDESAFETVVAPVWTRPLRLRDREATGSIANSIYYSSVLQFVQQSYYSCGVTPR